MERLKRRSDFRAVAQAAGAGARAHASAFTLQARARAQPGDQARDQAGPPRVGFTVSKQVGNAVERNRVRRRLRELVRLAPPAALSPGHDYVLIGRRAALKIAFDAMMKELSGALRRVHDGAKHDGAKHDGAKHDGAKHDGAKHDSAKPDSAKHGAGKSGGGAGASGALPPHRAGPSKRSGGKRQMRTSQHEH
jgi:ribonuclease P protein component